jgi:hypothetical protein
MYLLLPKASRIAAVVGLKAEAAIAAPIERILDFECITSPRVVRP